MVWGRAGDFKCVKSFVSTPTLYPTKNVNMDDNNKTVVASNCQTYGTKPKSLLAPKGFPAKKCLP